jgi:hypothetical protein
LGLQEAENGFSGPFDSLKNRFLEFVQVSFLNALKAENDYPLKCRYHELAQDAFCACHKAEHRFVGPDDLLKHHFPDFEQVAFRTAEKAENAFAVPGVSRNIAFST